MLSLVAVFAGLFGAATSAFADFSYQGQLGATTMTAGRVLGAAREPLGGIVVPLKSGAKLRYMYCITFGKYYPGSKVKYGAPVPFTGDLRTTSRATAGLTSWLIQRYGMSPGTGKNDPVDNNAAGVSAQVGHIYDEVNQNGQWQYLGQSGTSVAAANALLADSKKFAGPYTISSSALPAAVPGGTYTFTRTITNAYGPVGAGIKVKLTSSGVTLSATGASTNAHGQFSVKYTLPAKSSATAIAISASTSVIDTLHEVRRVSSTSPHQVQDFIGAATTASTYTGTSHGPVQHPATPQPTMSTQASDQTAVVGSALSDSIDLNGTLGAGGTITANLYGPASSPTGPWTTIAGTVQLPAHGDGNYTTPIVTVSKPGIYTWSNSFTITGQTTPAVTTAPGDVEESTTVTQPTMRTQASTQRAFVGAQLTDSINVAATSGASGTITAKLYGPAKTQAGPWTTLAGTVTLPVNGDGSYTTPAVTISKPGIYSWSEDFRVPGQTVPVASTAPGDVVESTTVTQPTMITQTSTQNAVVGAKLTDKITVTWSGAGCGTIIATLYGPAPTQTGPWIAVAGTSTVQVCRSGVYTTAPVTLTQPGIYSWSERLGAPGHTTPIATTPAGQVSETTTVSAPRTPATAPPTRIDTGGDTVRSGGPFTGALELAGWLLLAAAGFAGVGLNLARRRGAQA